MNHRMVFVSLCTVFAISAYGSPAAVFAVEGTLAYFAGEVTVTRNGIDERASIGMVVLEGDVVKTGDGSTAIIALEDGADLKMRENATLSLERLGERTEVRLLSGSLFSRIVKHTLKGFGVRTETTLAGVRGTEFFIAYGRKIDESADVWLCVNEGSVEVSIVGTSRRVTVRQGEGINIVGGLKLTKPKKYGWTRNLNWNTDPGRGDVLDDTDLDEAYSDLLDQDYD